MFAWDVEPLLLLFVASIGYNVVLLVVADLLGKSKQLLSPHFTARKYYLLMGWAPFSFILLGLLCDPRYLPFALIAGLAGIAGETLVSVVWMRFFDRPIWTYSYQAVLGGFTSTLNLLPWMVGALLFVSAARLLGYLWPPADEPAASPVLVSAGALLVGATAAWSLLRALGGTRSDARRFSPGRFVVFCLPVVVTGLALGLMCDLRYVALMTLFAAVGTVTEYGYGRTMSLFFKRALWTYNHLKLDGGHSSLVTLPLWAVGGLYFHLIAEQLGLV